MFNCETYKTYVSISTTKLPFRFIQFYFKIHRSFLHWIVHSFVDNYRSTRLIRHFDSSHNDHQNVVFFLAIRCQPVTPPTILWAPASLIHRMLSLFCCFTDSGAGQKKEASKVDFLRTLKHFQLHQVQLSNIDFFWFPTALSTIILNRFAFQNELWST